MPVTHNMRAHSFFKSTCFCCTGRLAKERKHFMSSWHPALWAGRWHKPWRLKFLRLPPSMVSGNCSSLWTATSPVRSAPQPRAKWQLMPVVGREAWHMAGRVTAARVGWKMEPVEHHVGLTYGESRPLRSLQTSHVWRDHPFLSGRLWWVVGPFKAWKEYQWL